MFQSERRSTVRVNKERLKAAMEAADRAEAGATSEDSDVYKKLDDMLLQATEIVDARQWCACCVVQMATQFKGRRHRQHHHH